MVCSLTRCGPSPAMIAAGAAGRRGKGEAGLRRIRLFGSGAVGLAALAFALLPSQAKDPPPSGANSAAPPAAASPPPAAAPKLALVKPPPAGAGTLPWLPDYLRVLERFPFAHARNWHELQAGGETLGFFGSGDRAGAAGQARALLVMAYLAGEPGYDPRPSGIPAAAVREQALRSLRHL